MKFVAGCSRKSLSTWVNPAASAQFLAPIPVYVITAPYPALRGCVQALSHWCPRVEAG